MTTLRIVSTATLLLLAAQATADPAPRDCASNKPVAGGEKVTALTCDGVSGFLVPSDLFRRPEGYAESYRLASNRKQKITELQLQVRQLGTATAALARARNAAVARVALFRGLYDEERADHATCETELMSCAQGRGSAVLWSSGIGLVVGAAACIGTAHALPQQR